MKYVQGNDRYQSKISTGCLDETIDADNPVRVIDAFVDTLPLETFGFRLDYGENGRPAYHPADLLKLFIYGYQNRIRSSRGLEAECKRNIELFWLMKELRPDHNTINRFRKDNAEAIRQVFRATVQTAQNLNLIGGALLATDSTKLRAQNSKKNNYNAKKIKRHIEYIDRKLDEYTQRLAQADGDHDDPDEPNEIDRDQINKDIQKHQSRRKQYQSLQQQLDETGEEQISTSDPDSRQMVLRGQITEVAYNVQSTVDARHHIPIDYHVTNQNDSKAMGPMLERAIEIIGHNQFTALFDKGYHTGSEFARANQLEVNVLVAAPAVSSHAPNPMFDVSEFNYNPTKDQYTCPAGKLLRTNGRWYTKSHGKTKVQVKHYKTKSCATCVLASACTRNPKGRLIERSEHTTLISENAARIAANPALYKKRQSIVEHPFGTMKRQWGFDHIMTKKRKHHAAADVGLMFVAYNLKRLMSLVSPQELKAALGGILGRFLAVLSLHTSVFAVVQRFFGSFCLSQPFSASLSKPRLWAT